MLKDFSAAIFDLDGTLVDSMGIWEEIDETFLSRRGLTASPAYRDALRAMNFEQAADFTVATFGLSDTREQIVAEWNDMAVYEYAHNVAAKPGAEAYLKKLASRGVALALATASPRSLYEPALRRLGLYDLFSAFTTSAEVARGKGYPDIYLLAAQRLNTPPERCVVFEDIYPAVCGARAAGMQVVGVYDERSAGDRPAMERDADLYIQSLTELL